VIGAMGEEENEFYDVPEFLGDEEYFGTIPTVAPRRR
jgi:hypothetical protein